MSPVGDPPRIVALGGGHGLAATLAAARQLTPELTAIVTVADDGGSSGQIRRELEVLPPGDLRMALAALAGSAPEHHDMAKLLQHRFGGSGTLAGHPVGNLLLTGLLEVFGGDPVRALDTAGGMIGAVGRVLPMSTIPLEITAWVDEASVDPLARRLVRGQVAVATTPGRVRSVQLVPAAPPACAEAVAAVEAADIVVLGPGSWFTSVLPHLLVPDLLHALERTAGQVVVVLNLRPQAGETEGFSPEEHLSVLRAHAPGLPVHTVLADPARVVDRRGLLNAVQAIRTDSGSEPRLLLRPVASTAMPGDQHDPRLLAVALDHVINCATRTREQPVWP